MEIEIKLIDVPDWHTTEEQSNVFEHKLSASIRKYGQTRPIAVIEVGERYLCIEGRKILTTIKRLGFQEIEAKVFAGVNPVEFNLTMNNLHPDICYIGISEALAHVKQSYNQLNNYVPWTSQELKYMKELKSFDWESYKDTPPNQMALFDE